MNSATRTALLILCAALTLLPAAPRTVSRAQGPAAAGPVTPCDLAAYVIDNDPNGLNVRSGPGATFKVIGNLPNRDVEGVGVHITGSSGEWVRIDRAVEQGGEQERTFFSGEGWVYGPLLGTDGVGWIAGGTPLYRQPTKRSGVVTRMQAGGEGAVVRGCRGKWMYLEHKKARGWAEGEALCDNSLTNCS